MDTLRLGPYAAERFQVPFDIPLLDIRSTENSQNPPVEEIARLLEQRTHVLMRVEQGQGGDMVVSVLLDEWLVRARGDRETSDQSTDRLFMWGVFPANAGHKVDFLKRSYVVEVPRWLVGTLQQSPERSEGRRQALTEVLKAIYTNLEGLAPDELSASGSDGELGRALDELFSLVEIEHELELEKQRGSLRATFIKVEPDARSRGTTRITYRFHMASDHELEEDDFVEVELKNGEMVSGQIVHIDDDIITISFRSQFDYEDLVVPGLLSPSLNVTQYNVRKRVLVGLARERTSAQYLLPLLAKKEFPEPAGQGGIVDPPGRFTESQRRGVTVGSRTEGVVLIQGPPGTGKTTVIQEWVEHFVRQGQKVLISSQSNMAVDNVLERFLDLDRLSPDLGDVNVVRVGHEAKVAASVHEALLDNRARILQARIIESSRENAKPFFDHKETIDALLEQLTRSGDLEQRLSYDMDELQRARERLKASESKLSDAKTEEFHADARVGALEREEARMIALLGPDALDKSFFPLWSPIQFFRSRKLQSIRVDLMRARHRQVLRQRHRTEVEEQAVVHRQAEAHWEATVRQTRSQLRETEAKSRNFIRFELDPTNLPSAFRPDGDLLYDPENASKNMHEWALRMQSVMGILEDWYALLSEREEAMYRLTLQLVDVVGGTCVGINSNRHFSEIEFGVTIIDEAGQIPVHDIMVPLSRSPKSIMVGDHLQLPPVVQSETKARLEEAGLDVDLVQKSLFEQLYDAAPDSTKIMLDTQFRMPGEIADFISDQFYDGAYKSHESKRGLKPLLPLFKHPFVVVDTSGRRDRWDRYDGQSYRNVLEAHLVSILLRHALRNGVAMDELGVITPYKAQATYIYELLATRYRLIDETGVLKDNVATVDAFQGQERDLIMYSFTRSNRKGRVGFLSELRRLNVALTRPKKQLVIFGDFSTLQHATDESFAATARALVQRAQKNGDFMSVQELRNRLVSLQTQRI